MYCSSAQTLRAANFYLTKLACRDANSRVSSYQRIFNNRPRFLHIPSIKPPPDHAYRALVPKPNRCILPRGVILLLNLRGARHLGAYLDAHRMTLRTVTEHNPRFHSELRNARALFPMTLSQLPRSLFCLPSWKSFRRCILCERGFVTPYACACGRYERCVYGYLTISSYFNIYRATSWPN